MFQTFIVVIKGALYNVKDPKSIKLKSVRIHLGNILYVMIVLCRCSRLRSGWKPWGSLYLRVKSCSGVLNPQHKQNMRSSLLMIMFTHAHTKYLERFCFTVLHEIQNNLPLHFRTQIVAFGFISCNPGVAVFLGKVSGVGHMSSIGNFQLTTVSPTTLLGSRTQDSGSHFPANCCDIPVTFLFKKSRCERDLSVHQRGEPEVSEHACKCRLHPLLHSRLGKKFSQAELSSE